MARIIKRYDNRKLYDTTTSEYVSLSDIADLVRRGNTVQVVDNPTGEDITAQTLTQIILEEGKNGRQVIPSDLLHDLLRRSGEALDTGLGQIQAIIDDLMQSSLGRLQHLMQNPRRQEFTELRQQLTRLDERLSALLDELDERSDNSSGDEQTLTPDPVDSESPEPEREPRGH